MTEFESNSELEVIVVGSSLDEFVRGAMNVLGSCDVRPVRCEDVYSAAGKVTDNARTGLVIGRLEQLNREGGRFFDIARRNGFSCCCFVDRNLPEKRREILAVIESGAFVVTEPTEIKDVLKELSGAGGARAAEEQGGGGVRGLVDEVVEKILGDGGAGSAGNRGASNLVKDELRTTQDELDALLGA